MYFQDFNDINTNFIQKKNPTDEDIDTFFAEVL